MQTNKGRTAQTIVEAPKKVAKEVTMAYVTVLKGYIDSIVTSHCFGCMVGVADLHTTCLDRKGNVRDYFEDTMNAINETDVLALIKKKAGK